MAGQVAGMLKNEEMPQRSSIRSFGSGKSFERKRPMAWNSISIQRARPRNIRAWESAVRVQPAPEIFLDRLTPARRPSGPVFRGTAEELSRRKTHSRRSMRWIWLRRGGRGRRHDAQAAAGLFYGRTGALAYAGYYSPEKDSISFAGGRLDGGSRRKKSRRDAGRARMETETVELFVKENAVSCQL